MSVYVAHLVLVALGDANDQVVDEGLDSAESGDALTRAMVELDVDGVGLWVGERDRKMAKVLDQLAAGALDGDGASLDVDLDCKEKMYVSSRSWFSSMRRRPSRWLCGSCSGRAFECAGGARTALRDFDLLLRVNVQHGGRLSGGTVVVWSPFFR